MVKKIKAFLLTRPRNVRRLGQFPLQKPCDRKLGAPKRAFADLALAPNRVVERNAPRAIPGRV